RLAVHPFEADDEAEARVGRTAHDLLALSDYILGLDRPAFEPGLLERSLEALVGSVVPRPVAKSTLGNDQGYGCIGRMSDIGRAHSKRGGSSKQNSGFHVLVSRPFWRFMLFFLILGPWRSG